MDQQAFTPDHWTQPRELARTLPRDVRLSNAGIVAAVTIILLLAAAPFWLAQTRKQRLHDLWQISVLRDRGQVASAKVLQLWRQPKGGNLYVKYEFMVGRRQWFQASAATPAAVWAKLRIGAPLPIRFLPEDPAVNHPAAWELEPLANGLIYLLPAILVTIAFSMLWNLRVQAALLANGLVARGEVTGRSGRSNQWTFRYRFRAADGSLATGLWNGKTLPDNSTVCVLYDPEKPARNRAYPVIWYRLV